MGWEPKSIELDDGEKRNIGFYNKEKGIFYTKRWKDNQHLNKFNSWSVNKDKFDEMLEEGLEWVVIDDRRNEEDEKYWKVKANKFSEKGEEIAFNGMDIQLMLDDGEWKVTDK